MKNIYLIGGISLIGDLILIIFIIFPLITGIQNDSKELISLKSELSVLEQTKGNAEELKKLSALHQQDAEAINAIFIDPKIPIDFIRFVETTASESGTTLEVSYDENSVSFDIALEGSFSAFLKFLTKLENGPYPLEISSLNIKRTTGGKISATLILSVLAKTNGG